MGAVVVLAGCAWWVVGLPPFSGGATVAVVGAGAGAMALGWWERRRPQVRTVGGADAAGPASGTTGPRGAGGSGGGAGVIQWVVLLVVTGAWQLAAYLQHPRAEHPTISSMTNALLDSHVTRAAAFVLWLAVARGLARR